MVLYSNMRTPVIPACPISNVIILLSDRWTMQILYQLNLGVKGFCELETALSGISTRTLTLKLKKLIDEGLVVKLPSGKYETTRRGKGLRVLENAMRKYADKYL